MDGARVESCPQRFVGQRWNGIIHDCASSRWRDTLPNILVVVSLSLPLSLSTLHSHPILFLCINHWAANPGANGLGWWNFFAT